MPLACERACVAKARRTECAASRGQRVRARELFARLGVERRRGQRRRRTQERAHRAELRCESPRFRIRAREHRSATGSRAEIDIASRLDAPPHITADLRCAVVLRRPVPCLYKSLQAALKLADHKAECAYCCQAV
eukprot:4951154-Pleurochrysis_carterae.AAC.2